MLDPITGQSGRPLAIAHRGDPIAFRENTIDGVAAAVEAGADMVEIDVKTTSDGTSVVLHDDSLQRLWRVDRDVRTMTAAEVASVGIPTLDEVLAVFEDRACAVLVDMSSPEWATAARYATARAVAAGRLRASQILWCGNGIGLREVRDADPEARIFLSWGAEALDGPPPDELVDALRPEAFNPHWQVLESGGREWAQSRALALSCWTVDDPALMSRLLHDGVDAMISNDVRALVAAMETVRG